MGSISRDIRRGLKSLERALDTPKCSVNGAQDIPCVPSSIKRGTSIVLGGVEVAIQLTLNIRPEFVNEPLSGVDAITFQGTEYRVLQVGLVVGGSHWEVDLGDANA